MSQPPGKFASSTQKVVVISVAIGMALCLLAGGLRHRGFSIVVGPAAEAWQASTDYVAHKQFLALVPHFPSPSDPSVTIERLSEDSYQITGWGEGYDQFGPLLHLDWTCVAEYEGAGMWQVRDYSTLHEAKIQPSVQIASQRKANGYQQLVDYYRRYIATASSPSSSRHSAATARHLQSCLRPGMVSQQIKRAIGSPDTTHKDEGDAYLIYQQSDGILVVEIQNDRLANAQTYSYLRAVTP
jgi:hypothetical protein